MREISDNDGGHTSPYLAAMSFKYAVTGDEEARKEAVESFKAMLWLEGRFGRFTGQMVPYSRWKMVLERRYVQR